MQKRIYLSSPHMGGNELSYIHQAFDQNWIAPLGPNVDGFEAELAVYSGAPFAAALSSGTAAIHLALILLGVQRDDYVICQSFTFSASANPIVYQGANPVFVDSEEETWNMCPNALEEAIKSCIAKGKKPKTIIYVHLYGMPAKIKELQAIAEKYEIPTIEDAAEALGSTYAAQMTGTFGDLGVFSFNGNKIITTSGGGALVSKGEEWIKKARFLATQARDAAPHYEHSHIGYNYRMSNISAGIGRGQLEVIADRVAKRRSIFEQYKEAFSDIEGITFLLEPPGSTSNRWLTTILLDPVKLGGVNREDIRLDLEQHNIESRPLWKPMHMQPVFRDYPFYGTGVAEQLFDKGLCLPSGSNLSEEELASVIKLLKGNLK